MGLAKQKNESAAKGLGLANEKTKAQRKAWVWQMKKRKRAQRKGRQEILNEVLKFYSISFFQYYLITVSRFTN
jgi:hypothetical protein